jgi:hypothetical protein
VQGLGEAPACPAHPTDTDAGTRWVLRFVECSRLAEQSVTLTDLTVARCAASHPRQRCGVVRGRTTRTPECWHPTTPIPEPRCSWHPRETPQHSLGIAPLVTHHRACVLAPPASRAHAHLGPTRACSLVAGGEEQSSTGGTHARAGVARRAVDARPARTAVCRRRAERAAQLQRTAACLALEAAAKLAPGLCARRLAADTATR